MAVEVEELRGLLEDYLRQRGMPLRKAFRCLSPAHEDKHPSMSYDSRRRNVHCFACGITYDLFDLVGLDYGLDKFDQQVDKVCVLFGIERPRLEYRREENPVVESELQDRMGELIVLPRSEDCTYFFGRGIEAESCEKYGLFQGEGRAYFPVMERGRCTGWTARAVSDEVHPRYKNSTGSLGLWNGDYLLQNGGGGRLFVTEGIVDAICLEQLGQRAVALCGSQNVGKLLRRCEAQLSAANNWQFVACGDGDLAGQGMNQALQEGLGRLGLSCSTLELQPGDDDIGGLYLSDRQRLEELIGQGREAVSEYAATSAAAGLEAFFDEAERRARCGALSTGFPGLDRLLDGGLYPGLYVLGAISSLGKTSFVLQIADYLAENNADVLFFSLEQSRFELMAKSLSRTSAQLDAVGRGDAFTVRQLLCGMTPATLQRRQLLLDSRKAYSKAATGLFIREGIADIGVEEIRAAVREHQQQRGTAPVVVVDYLQILRPTEQRATDKQNTDRAVVELKRLSRDFDIPVIAISSFNRENYRAAVSMEAFKESGAVEYSSDVLLGMQLMGAGGKEFDANIEKTRDPRRVELVMLKNRNGIPYAKVALRYYAKFGLFEETGK